MKTVLTDEEKKYLADAIERFREGESTIAKGKAMKEEARDYIVGLLGADTTDTKAQIFTDDGGLKIVITGVINRNVNTSALQYFMETGHPELKDRLARCFYPKWELSKKEWDLISDEEQAILIGEQVVTESVGKAKLTVK